MQKQEQLSDVTIVLTDGFICKGKGYTAVSASEGS